MTIRTLWQTTQFFAEYRVKVLRERGVVAIPCTYHVRSGAAVFVIYATYLNMANFADFCKPFMKKGRKAAFFSTKSVN